MTGVTLADGETLRAPLVVSGAHPQTTVLDLTGAEHFPDEVVADMRRYRTRGASVKVNLVLARPPRYAGVTEDEQRMLLHTGVALCASVDAPRARLAGGGPRHAGDGAVHRGRGPVGGRPDARRRRRVRRDDVHPVRPARRGRLARRQPRGVHGRVPRACSTRSRRASADTVVHAEVLAPPDLERIFGLRGGSIFHGEQDLAQLAFMRPSPDLARYATPVGGLYLCGAGTHPGGGVMGASGHNAAMRVLRDRRRAQVKRRVRARV